MRPIVLFEVAGRPVVRGDVLFHRDLPRTGGRVTAEFEAEGDTVVVRSPNGAVPRVRVSELSWERHPEDVLREQFLAQLREKMPLHSRNRAPTDRDFQMWLLGRQSLL